MSYARSGKDSDVYVIGTIFPSSGQTYLECMGCELTSTQRNPAWDYSSEKLPDLKGPEHLVHGSFTALTPGGMLKHLRLHLLLGDKVPDYAMERLEAEKVEYEASREAHWATLMAEGKAARAAKEAGADGA